ncbi:MAG: hypothetical protein ABIQ95_09245, partial [Bdellovibrionia bacterium]
MKLLALVLFLGTIPFVQDARSESAPDLDKIKVALIIDQPNALMEVQEEAPESSPSSPPLATDDPGTPGTDRYEINSIVDCDFAQGSRGCEEGIDAAFGLGEKIQFRISKYYAEDKTDGEHSHVGFGATDMGIKDRFYDRDGLQLAVFPSLQLNDESQLRNSDGTKI